MNTTPSRTTDASQSQAENPHLPASAASAFPLTLEHFDQLPDSAFVRQPVVEKLFACSAATVWRRVADSRIPKPRKLSERVTVWNVGQLRAALASVLTGRAQ
jgi:predicted DNA-binding transcriptional regulator AlpA